MPAVNAFVSALANNAGEDWAAMRCILLAASALAVYAIGIRFIRRGR